MPARFICRSVDPNNGIVQIHLTLDEGQPNEVYINATALVLNKMIREAIQVGDEIGVQLKVISRAGQNGKHKR